MFTVALVALSSAGCTRDQYRLAADHDAYHHVQQQTACTPWQPHRGYSVYADPRSRFANGPCLSDPALPIPAPQLYAYDIPELPPHEHWEDVPTPSLTIESNNALQPPQPISPQVDVPTTSPYEAQSPSPLSIQERTALTIQQANYEVQLAPPMKLDSNEPVEPLTLPPPDPTTGDDVDSETGPRVQPVPRTAWQTLPPTCLIRMLEFDSIQREYEQSFDRSVTSADLDEAKRLSLESIVQLAAINSREYQSQKEALYRTALNLSLERYAFQLKFAPFGNGTTVDYRHSRNNGVTVNTLSVPSRAQLEMVLATGGDFLARFANNVVLTFNGPQGFASDITSEMFFEFSQSVFQRDIRFERLTQAERDVVYAARDYARFRKVLFTQLATDYYRLLLTFRRVEIDAQNYFTLVRAFEERTAELRSNQASRIQVDQVEQNVLRGRSRLIATCVGLEGSLDDLKIRMGLPTETPINLDLEELHELSIRDELSVAAELIQRVRRSLGDEQQTAEPNLVNLLSGAIRLIERRLRLIELQNELAEEANEAEELRRLQAQLQVDESRIDARTAQQELAVGSTSKEVTFSRTSNLADQLRRLVTRQLTLAERSGIEAEKLEPLAKRVDVLANRLKKLTNDDGEEESNENGDALDDAYMDGLIKETAAIISQLSKISGELDRLTSADKTILEQDAAVGYVTKQLNDVLGRASGEEKDDTAGLVPIEIDVDDAMMTALVLRFDLMNQRGFAADDWRAIKLAGDDLKSVLNLRASQEIRTRRNQPLNFTFDESETRLRLEFDAPLNRRAQRNAFRNRLIDYQAALRGIMGLEDTIKLSVRDDLRALSLDREQYQIDVASAALAYERVLSTEKSLRLGVQGVASRDFLEAQDDYTSAISNVATRHINYVLDRMQLFLDLELLEVDNDGYWPAVNDEAEQPTPHFQLPPHALPAYGHLPHGVWYSKKVKRMYHVPTGTSMNHRAVTPSTDSPEQTTNRSPQAFPAQQ